MREIEATLDPADPINVQYTSGTTGLPKGATLSHRNILNNGYFVVRGLPHTDDRLCIPVPFYHCFGIVMANLGFTTPVPRWCCRRPRSTEPTVAAITESAARPARRANHVRRAARPPADEAYNLSTLRTGIMAGDPLPIEVMKQCIEQMNWTRSPICYGMTETSPVSP